MAASLLISCSPLPLFTSNGRHNVRPISVRAQYNFPDLNLSTELATDSSRTLKFSRRIPLAGGTSIGDGETADTLPGETFVGEDSAKFELGEQKVSSWVYFAGILGAVLFALDVLWIDPSTGYGAPFVKAVSGISESKEVAMLILIFLFAAVHSGMASLRDVGEKLIGERAYRVLFAGISLPLVVSTVVYFINHRYDGTQLWQVQSVPGVHELVWVSNFISFFFLYPSTFNLLEVAAVDKPRMHLWETGIMRITRHPQMVGQVMWCIAHTIWIGNTVTAAASVGLIGHHLFGVWNGDRRLNIRYGEAFDDLKSRTSVVPFAAIFDGRQKLPKGLLQRIHSVALSRNHNFNARCVFWSSDYAVLQL